MPLIMKYSKMHNRSERDRVLPNIYDLPRNNGHIFIKQWSHG